MGNKILADELVSQAVERFHPDVEVVGEGFQKSLIVPKARILEVLKFLKTDEAFQMNFLGNQTAVEFPQYFEVVYHLYSLPLLHSITVKTRTAKEDPAVPSAFGVYKTAEYQEREVYDLMGVSFTGHPDMRRILLPDHFEGHPLRKDYKLPPRPPGN